MSTVALLSLTGGGQSLTAGSLSLLSDTRGADPAASILLTPLIANGTAYGQRTVTPADGPVTGPSADSAALAPAGLAGLFSVQSPVTRAVAGYPDGGASTEAGASSLGAVTLLGLPMPLAGTLEASTLVSRTGSVGQQTFELTDLSMPSVADLLGALGLDLSALPVDVLVELLTALDLVTSTVSTADEALDAAQALLAIQTTAATAAVDAQLDAVDAAAAQVLAQTGELASLESALLGDNAALAAAQAALAPAAAALAAAQADAGLAQTAFDALETVYLGTPVLLQPALLPALTLAQTTLTTATALVAQTAGTVASLTAAVAAADSVADLAAAAVAAASAAVDLAQSVLDAAQVLLDAAQAALAALLTTLAPLVQALLAAVTVVLDDTPLLSLDALSVVSRATATDATPTGQSAEVTGGEVEGLHLLGTDVLSDVLGTSSVDLLALTGTQLGTVNALMDQLTGTLSDILSTVPGFPALSIPAPVVELLTQATTTGASEGFGTAGTNLRALSITLPAVTIPSALALPGAASLPAFGGISQVTGLLSSAPITVALANLGNGVRFSPAATGPVTGLPGTTPPGTSPPGTTPPGATPPGATPPGATPPRTATPGTDAPRGTVPLRPVLASTGASTGLAALAVLFIAGAVVLRRRQDGLG